MKMKRMQYLFVTGIALAAMSVWADTRVLWLPENNPTAIHRFNVTGEGTDEESWTEADPLVTFASGQNIMNVIPAHGYYYVCYYGGVRGPL